MARFDPKHTADAFHRIAIEAERYMREAKSKIPRSSSYRGIHDDHLAKFHLYYYLAVQCESRERLLAELTRLTQEPHPAPSDAFDPSRFASAYQGWIRQEIARLSGFA